ncbi:RT0821/Lpp0805 family surface protein [Paraburkholderia bonniea]|uniref:RT0821/Lpp0805 family surface protein n=1 Tax=Paraburkholderia bonniea TaxID=2152891 RepID=UPI0012910699|nr:RT0821/Lpp0805 family surface protein [Paraburkholderia bonniea]
MSKRIRTPLYLMLGSVLLASMCGAQAANLGFLNDTPISYMKPRDVASVKVAVFEALDKQQDGKGSNWVNEGTGNSVRIEAVITPKSTATDGDRTCRTVTVELEAKGQLMRLNPQFCRHGSGKWQLQKKS